MGRVLTPLTRGRDLTPKVPSLGVDVSSGTGSPTSTPPWTQVTGFMSASVGSIDPTRY